MNRFAGSLTAVVAAIALLATACGDPSGPAESVAPSQSVSLPSDGDAKLLNVTSLLVKTVAWYNYCGAGLSASGKIGPKGGTIDFSKCDVTITVPAGALSTTTTITITSTSGSYVSYDIQPHGLTFPAPVIVTQKLKYTAATRDPLVALTLLGVYVSGIPLISSDGSFLATELLDSKTTYKLDGLKLVPDKQTWKLNHFSRYMLASG
ncbi:MAG TPA: hypothetical protein VIF83_13970 [Gemmatimonadaceae bacterium]|jgi:hypothetical protein